MDPILAGTAAIAILGATTVIQSIRLHIRRADYLKLSEAHGALTYDYLREHKDLTALQDKERKRLEQIKAASHIAAAKRHAKYLASKAERERATLEALGAAPLRPREEVVSDTPRRLAKAQS